MDSLDARLLRASFRAGINSLTGFDPRRNIAELANRAGTSRLTVRRRLRQWTKSGFRGPTAIFPNPDQLGCAFYFQGFAVEGADSLMEFERAATESSEIVFVFQVQQFYGVLELAPSAKRLAPLARRLGRIPHVRAQFAPIPVRFPSSKRPLRRSDWIIIRAFRRLREIDWRRVASDVEMTPRRLRRRVSQLVDADQIFFFPQLDFRKSEGTVALVIVFLLPELTEPEIRRQLLERFPDHIEVENLYPTQIALPASLRGPLAVNEGPASPIQVPAQYSFFLPIPSIASGDELHRELSRLPGVFQVLITYPVHDFEVPACFDRRVERMLPNGKVTAHSKRCVVPSSTSSEKPAALGR
jgi:DNA-binding Lrp family transcriptional regulator